MNLISDNPYLHFNTNRPYTSLGQHIFATTIWSRECGRHAVVMWDACRMIDYLLPEADLKMGSIMRAYDLGHHEYPLHDEDRKDYRVAVTQLQEYAAEVLK